MKNSAQNREKSTNGDYLSQAEFEPVNLLLLEFAYQCLRGVVPNLFGPKSLHPVL